MKSIIAAAVVFGFFCACMSKSGAVKGGNAEQQSGYGYVALEPSEVYVKCSKGGKVGSCGAELANSDLLKSLPDNSVRISTRLISGSASAGIGGVGTTFGFEGKSYEVVIDFVNTQTVNMQFEGKWRVDLPDNVVPAGRCYPYERSILGLSPVNDSEIWTLSAKPLDVGRPKQPDTQEVVLSDFSRKEDEQISKTVTLRCGDLPLLPMDQYASLKDKKDYYTTEEANIAAVTSPFNVPVYVGIGLRLKAHVTVNSGSVNLSSLAAITAAVKSNDATGTMSVQTLGVTGKAARSGLLFLDRIDETTIQNAVQVLASIKASIESDSQDTTLSPRIIGFHNTVAAGPQGINLIHSHLAASKLTLTINECEQNE